MHRDKYYCPCGWAAKGPCPREGHESILMHSNWRPGKKGSKFRLWDNRVKGSVTTQNGNGSRYNGWKFYLKSKQPPSQFMINLGAKDSSYGA